MSGLGQREIRTRQYVVALDRMGTGTRDMIRRCAEAGLAEPEFRLTDRFVTTIRRKMQRATGEVGREVTGDVTPEVALEVRLVLASSSCASSRAGKRRISLGPMVLQPFT